MMLPSVRKDVMICWGSALKKNPVSRLGQERHVAP